MGIRVVVKGCVLHKKVEVGDGGEGCADATGLLGPRGPVPVRYHGRALLPTFWPLPKIRRTRG